jgi:transcriptional regulator with XRE-family HTH domain
MLTLEECKTALVEPDCNISEVARAINVTPSYLWLLAHGQRLNPSYHLVKRLSDYLELQHVDC